MIILILNLPQPLNAPQEAVLYLLMLLLQPLNSLFYPRLCCLPFFLFKFNLCGLCIGKKLVLFHCPEKPDILFPVIWSKAAFFAEKDHEIVQNIIIKSPVMRSFCVFPSFHNLQRHASHCPPDKMPADRLFYSKNIILFYDAQGPDLPLHPAFYLLHEVLPAEAVVIGPGFAFKACHNQKKLEDIYICSFTCSTLLLW